MSKRILLCAYAFPPMAGAQALKWFYLVKHLAFRGWEIDILTIKPSEGYPKYDDNLLSDLPGNVRIFRTYAGFLHNIVYKKKRVGNISKSKKSSKCKSTRSTSIKMLVLRKAYRGTSYLLIPDRMIEWLPFALIKGRNLIKKRKYDVLVSHGFPFSSHIVALFLKKWSNLPWVIDNSDPWAFHPSNYPKIIRFLNRIIEKKILNATDKVVVNTEETKEGYMDFYPFLDEEKIKVVQSGFNDELYEKIERTASDRFKLVFTGNLSYSVRDPLTFFDSLKAVVDIDMEVVVAGNVSLDIVDYVNKNNIANIKFLGFVSQEEVVALQKSASVLFLFGWTEGYQVPIKLFEYMAAKRPILYISYGEDDAGSKIVKRYNKGIVTSTDPQEISNSIKKLYHLWKEKEYDKEFDLSSSTVLSWKKRTAEFESVINEVIK